MQWRHILQEQHLKCHWESRKLGEQMAKRSYSCNGIQVFCKLYSRNVLTCSMRNPISKPAQNRKGTAWPAKSKIFLIMDIKVGNFVVFNIPVTVALLQNSSANMYLIFSRYCEMLVPRVNIINKLVKIYVDQQKHTM